MNKLRKLLVSFTAASIVGVGFWAATASAQAGDYSYGGHGYHGGHANHGSYSRAPHYHAPSVHYHRTYHADYYHWTPGRGLHSHGHYDVTPHYTPGRWHW